LAIDDLDDGVWGERDIIYFEVPVGTPNVVDDDREKSEGAPQREVARRMSKVQEEVKVLLRLQEEHGKVRGQHGFPDQKLLWTQIDKVGSIFMSMTENASWILWVHLGEEVLKGKLVR
jgi:hypothetical protein